MPVVLVFQTNDQTVEFPLLSRSLVGRSSSCDLTVEDKQMSGKHGSFEMTSQGQVLYTDLGSTNGSFLNNSQIQKTILKLNDTLRLGNTHVTIDEKSLNSKERLAIGKSIISDDQTLMVGTLSQTNSVVRGVMAIKEDEKAKKTAEKDKKSVILNKELKKKQPQQANWTARSDELTLEQEESSGNTKMLKLDKGMGLGKKKK